MMISPDILTDIHGHGYRVTHICEIRTPVRGWHAEIGTWGFSTDGRDRAFGRGDTMEAALDAAWKAAQSILPMVKQDGESAAPATTAAEETAAIVAECTDELEDVLG